jgi:hypothetical protein
MVINRTQESKQTRALGIGSIRVRDVWYGILKKKNESGPCVFLLYFEMINGRLKCATIDNYDDDDEKERAIFALVCLLPLKRT